MERKEFFVESDNDQPVVASVGAALNKFGELEVEFERMSYGRRRGKSKMVATVDRYDTKELAAALGVDAAEVSGVMAERLGDAGVNPSPSDVEALFGAALEFILDNGVRYRLKRD